jgi:hypothetical protein
MPALTLSNPQTALVNLDLSAVALCNEGANSRAHILLTKRREKTSMTFEELLKALNPEQAEIITQQLGSVEAAKDAKINELTSQLENLTKEVTELQKSKPADESAAQEDVLKNVSPEVKSLVEKLQSRVEALVASNEENLAKERYAKVKALPVPEPEATMAPVGKETNTEFAGDSAEASYSKLEKAAKALMAKEEGLSFEQAFTKACEQDVNTYQKYVKGV